MTNDDVFSSLYKDVEVVGSILELKTYEYLDLRIKLTYLMRIEEQLDAIRLCLIDMNKIQREQ